MILAIVIMLGIVLLIGLCSSTEQRFPKRGHEHKSYWSTTDRSIKP